MADDRGEGPVVHRLRGGPDRLLGSPGRLAEQKDDTRGRSDRDRPALSRVRGRFRKGPRLLNGQSREKFEERIKGAAKPDPRADFDGRAEQRAEDDGAGRIRVDAMEKHFVRNPSMGAEIVQSLAARLRTATAEVAIRHLRFEPYA